MQLNEATGEIEFNRNFAAVLQRRNTGEEDFNLERETLFQRIINIQNQLKLQTDTENELRTITDQVQAKLRHVEGLLAIKDEELMAARREI